MFSPFSCGVSVQTIAHLSITVSTTRYFAHATQISWHICKIIAANSKCAVEHSPHKSCYELVICKWFEVHSVKIFVQFLGWWAHVTKLITDNVKFSSVVLASRLWCTESTFQWGIEEVTLSLSHCQLWGFLILFQTRAYIFTMWFKSSNFEKHLNCFHPPKNSFHPFKPTEKLYLYLSGIGMLQG